MITMEISYGKQMSLKTIASACLSYLVEGINMKKTGVTGMCYK